MAHCIAGLPYHVSKYLFRLNQGNVWNLNKHHGVSNAYACWVYMELYTIVEMRSLVHGNNNIACGISFYIQNGYQFNSIVFHGINISSLQADRRRDGMYERAFVIF